MCPDKELLSAFADGEVPEPWSGRLRAHLEACPACSARLESFRALSRRLHGGPAAASVDAFPADSPASGAGIRPASEAPLVDRLRSRIFDEGVAPPPALWRRRVELPLPLAAAAAAAFLFLAGLLAARLVLPGAAAPSAIASARSEARQVPTGADMEALLRFLESQDAQVSVTIRLPQAATFENPGAPVLMREASLPGGTAP